MSSLAVSGIVFACIFGGALLGMWLRAVLPEHHLNPDSRDAVKLGMGLIATMAALVLGLLVASAKGTFDAQKSGLVQMSANVIMLDRVLARYGPATKEARELVRRAVVDALDRMWPEDASRPAQVQGTSESERVFETIQELEPKTDAQRALKAQAITITIGIARERWLLFTQRDQSLPVIALAVLVFWLAMLFASFSLFSPPNVTLVVTLVVCALSLAGAIFLIQEMGRPFDGVIHISSAPLRNVLAQLGK